MAQAATLPAGPPDKIRTPRFWDQYRVEFAMMGALLLLCTVLTFTADNFLTERNLRNVMWQSTAIGIVAIGQTLVILTAGIDLSVGGMAAVSAMVGGKVMLETNVLTGIAVTILVATLIGLVNGAFVAYGKLAPFIVTLGVMSICTSLTYVISDQSSITGLSDGYRRLGRDAVTFPFRDGGFAVQYYVFVFIGLYVVGHIMLTRTKPGRFIYAIGSNEEAARLSGVNTRAFKTLAYVISGFLCGVAALILSGRLGVIDPDNGSGWELQSIAAVVIGGTSLFGGKGSLVGTVIGVFLITILNNGLNLLRVSSFWQGTAVGAVIILSVLLERVFRNRGA